MASKRFRKFKIHCFVSLNILHYDVVNFNIRGPFWIFHGRKFSDRTCLAGLSKPQTVTLVNVSMFSNARDPQDISVRRFASV